ncbi:ABC transporter substrate-binding protein [Halalkalibacter kiskunsagensis]|uniref:ABC transporter substrate-binding protein n=1 Tax=Halalkalibacter kiskunsagensis TaxID=1548599 RepID=A0ABV6KCJ1_9BACI
MKKKGLYVGLTMIFGMAVAVFFFSSFSSDYEDQDDRRNSTDQIELTFWRNYGNPAENQAYEKLISNFEEAHPNILIDMQPIQYSDYELRLRTELAAGTPPDVLAIDSPNLALYANAGSLLSIDKYMREEGDLEDIPEATLNGMIFQNEIYLAPLVESSIALFYNKHLFKEAGVPFPSEDPDNPMTWEEVLEIARKVNNPEKEVYGIDPAHGFGDGESPAYYKMPLLWQFGASVLSADGTTASGYLDSQEAIEALQFYQDLYYKEGVASIELPPDPFETGHLAMTVIGSWHLTELEDNHQLKLEEDFGVAPLPKANHQVVPNGGWSLGISSKTKYPDEAWKFIRYMTSYEGMKKYVEVTGDIPARFSVANDFPELNEYPRNIFIQQAQTYSKNRPVTPAYPVVSDAIKTLFEEVGIGGKDVEASAKEAVEKINTRLAEIRQQ